MPELTVIMPVFNEEGSIRTVLEQWAEALQNLDIDYQIDVFNDGSRDNTQASLEICAQNNPRIKVNHKKNSGHGSTILLGYNNNCESSWIFQIDSDGEMGTNEFTELWKNRKNYDFLIGKRVQRKSPLSRTIITWTSRCVIWLLYGKSIFDVNCPYRLFKPKPLQKYLSIIPENTFAPNIIIAGIASKLQLRIYQMDVVHTERQTGVVSIKKWKLLRAALTSLSQTIFFRVRMMRLPA